VGGTRGERGFMMMKIMRTEAETADHERNYINSLSKIDVSNPLSKIPFMGKRTFNFLVLINHFVDEELNSGIKYSYTYV
jgi:hypothetical protein